MKWKGYDDDDDDDNDDKDGDYDDYDMHLEWTEYVVDCLVKC